MGSMAGITSIVQSGLGGLSSAGGAIGSGLSSAGGAIGSYLATPQGSKFATGMAQDFARMGAGIIASKKRESEYKKLEKEQKKIMKGREAELAGEKAKALKQLQYQRMSRSNFRERL